LKALTNAKDKVISMKKWLIILTEVVKLLFRDLSGFRVGLPESTGRNNGKKSGLLIHDSLEELTSSYGENNFNLIQWRA